MIGEWVRDCDGGWSAMVPVGRIRRGVHVWPVAGRRWMAATVGILPRRSGPHDSRAAAQDAAERMAAA